MALYKCPECDRMVSEHAKFCPQCGCVIEYILEFHRKQEEMKREKKDKASVKKETAPILNTLPGPALTLLNDFRTKLTVKQISYFYDEKQGFVGFRKSKDLRLLFYFSRRANGDLHIHIYNPSTDCNDSIPFDASKTSDYMESGLAAFSSSAVGVKPILKNKETPESVFISSTKEELAQICKYTIRNKRIVPICVVDVTLDKGHYRVWFSFENGERKFCLLSNVDNILFDSIESAEQHIKDVRVIPNPQAIFETGAKHEAIYALKSNGQYITGFHETKQYESELFGYGFRKRSRTFAKVKVPEFGAIQNALKFYTKESAEKFACSIAEQVGYQFDIVQIDEDN